MVTKFTGMELDPEHEDFADAIGELVNMISGGAKAQLEGKEVNISCPSVVIGSSHKVVNPLDVICILLPCKTQVGDFEVEVALKKSSITPRADREVAAAAG